MCVREKKTDREGKKGRGEREREREKERGHDFFAATMIPDDFFH